MSHIQHPDSAHGPENSSVPPVPPATISAPSDRRAILAGIGGLAAGALLAGAKTAHAGPLNPPAGPVASTGKTLTEVEPRIAINSTNTPGSAATSSIFRITQPGSYYLTGNVIATLTNRHVISIAADGVTIDLNGFLIRGLGTLQGAFDGIFAEAGAERITIKNGHVELAGRHGINLSTAAACAVEGVVASNNLNFGITTGAHSTITNCTANNNFGSGIVAGQSNTVSNCTAANNTGNGISANDGSTVSNCSAFQNNANGINSVNNGTIFNCTANSNAIYGISTNLGSTVSNCTTNNNTNNGINTGDGNTVSVCTAQSNVGNGIVVGDGCTVADCTVRQNDLSGITCGGSCIIRGNTCSNNSVGGTGAGIRVFSGDSRIEGNMCANNGRGIVVSASGSIIIRNTVANNTLNWVIAIGNALGPIVVAGTNTVAVNGNGPVTSTLATTDPNANFSF